MLLIQPYTFLHKRDEIHAHGRTAPVRDSGPGDDGTFRVIELRMSSSGPERIWFNRNGKPKIRSVASLASRRRPIILPLGRNRGQLYVAILLCCVVPPEESHTSFSTTFLCTRPQFDWDERTT
jgi:hypothetical protein